MSQINNLTQEELLHLAVEATRRGEHGSSISYLKEGVTRFPDDAKLAYVLGAEFAQIGIYDKAENEMQRAILLDPELFTASFQLGLLQMTLGKVEEAKLSWKNIDKLPKEHSLWLFKTGLEELAAEKFAIARELLSQGISSNDFSPELSKDMTTILESMPPEEVNDGSKNTDSAAGQVWLNAYKSNTD
jgi:tetratricopeptide (TPR) repeat protein